MSPTNGRMAKSDNSLGTWYEKTEDDRYLRLVSVFSYQVPKLFQKMLFGLPLSIR